MEHLFLILDRLHSLSFLENIHLPSLLQSTPQYRDATGWPLVHGADFAITTRAIRYASKGMGRECAKRWSNTLFKLVERAIDADESTGIR